MEGDELTVVAGDIVGRYDRDDENNGRGNNYNNNMTDSVMVEGMQPAEPNVEIIVSSLKQMAKAQEVGIQLINGENIMVNVKWPVAFVMGQDMGLNELDCRYSYKGVPLQPAKTSKRRHIW